MLLAEIVFALSFTKLGISLTAKIVLKKAMCRDCEFVKTFLNFPRFRLLVTCNSCASLLCLQSVVNFFTCKFCEQSEVNWLSADRVVCQSRCEAWWAEKPWQKLRFHQVIVIGGFVVSVNWLCCGHKQVSIRKRKAWISTRIIIRRFSSRTSIVSVQLKYWMASGRQEEGKGGAISERSVCVPSFTSWHKNEPVRFPSVVFAGSLVEFAATVYKQHLRLRLWCKFYLCRAAKATEVWKL